MYPLRQEERRSDLSTYLLVRQRSDEDPPAGSVRETAMPAVTKMREDETTLRKAHMLVGGKWVESASGEWLEVEDPAHRRPFAAVPRGRGEDVARAVKFAAGAFPAWSRMVPRERGRTSRAHCRRARGAGRRTCAHDCA